jgi:hypothetical protein
MYLMLTFDRTGFKLSYYGSSFLSGLTDRDRLHIAPQQCTLNTWSLLTRAGAGATMARRWRLEAAISRRASARSNGPVGSMVPTFLIVRTRAVQISILYNPPRRRCGRAKPG